MKRFFLWLALIVLFGIVLDLLFGILFHKYVTMYGLKGDYETSEIVFRNYDQDFVVLGSSVALNSINTKTIEDSLGISTINGGANGQRFPFYLTSLKAILQQKKPKRVVLACLPYNLADEGIGPRYNFLAPYYNLGIGDIDSCLQHKGVIDDWLLTSNFYRLNTIWFRILLYNFVHAGIQGENGFVAKPLPPEFPQRLELCDIEEITDERRVQLLEFVTLCKNNNIPLTVIFTPQCVTLPAGYSNPIVDEVKSLGDSLGFKVLDHTVLPPFDKNDSLFYDGAHINIDGSEIYTKILLDHLKDK